VTSPGGVSLPLVTLFLLTFALALPTADNSQTPGPRIPVVQDWSHRHLVFGGGGSLEALVAAARDPRARNQWLLRNRGRFQAARDSNRSNDPFALRRELGRFDDPFGIIEQGKKGKEPRRKEALDIDWAFSLGTTAGMAAGTFPAKYSFNVAADPSCTNDFVVFPINATPGIGQANIVALQNLYSGGGGACGSAPTVRWAYYTDASSGPVKTSPVLSLDGTKVAFIESVGGGAVFSVLTPGTGTGNGVDATHPALPGTGNTASITRLSYTPAQTGCTGPPAASNTRSSPFVDYTGNGTAYVGADNGYIYKISPVFNGTPAVTACAQVTATTGTKILTSPVYDPTAQRVFIADGAPASSLYAFPANLGTPATIAPGIGTITDGPIVDGMNSFVYVFGGMSTQAGNVAQVPWTGTPFSTWGTATSFTIGGGANSSGTIRTGAFDDAYFTGNGPKGNPSSGNLYACGYQGTVYPTTNEIALYKYTFASGTGTLTASWGTSPNTNLSPQANTYNPGQCSPITSFKNGSDRMFVSTTQASSALNYSFEMWDITNPLVMTPTPSTPSAKLYSDTYYTGGTSGIIVDNQGTGTDQSNVYFGTLASSTQCTPTGYCAVKLTQSGLQ